MKYHAHQRFFFKPGGPRGGQTGKIVTIDFWTWMIEMDMESDGTRVVVPRRDVVLEQNCSGREGACTAGRGTCDAERQRTETEP